MDAQLSLFSEADSSVPIVCDRCGREMERVPARLVAPLGPIDGGRHGMDSTGRCRETMRPGDEA